MYNYNLLMHARSISNILFYSYVYRDLDLQLSPIFQIRIIIDVVDIYLVTSKGSSLAFYYENTFGKLLDPITN